MNRRQQMSFTDTLKKSVLQGFESTDISTVQIVLTLGITFLIALYIYFIYKFVTKSAFYNKGFHISMAIISVITAGIIIAMQSSIVISLGMVGALSIVRFRTAIKDPMDLLFLFWSIGTGIICGAGLYEIAIIVALMVTIGIFVLDYLPENKKPYLLILNCNNNINEEELIQIVRTYSKYYKIKSRNMKKTGCDMILEVYTKQEKDLLEQIKVKSYIEQMSLLSHDGEVRL